MIKRGDRFHHWTVMRPAQPDRKSNARFMCRCDCGTERLVYSWRLRTSGSKSCRCMQGVYMALAKHQSTANG